MFSLYFSYDCRDYFILVNSFDKCSSYNYEFIISNNLNFYA